MVRDAQQLIDGGTFFEGPRWRDGRWWVSDFYRHLVLTVTPEGDVEEVLEVPGQPSGLGWLPDGSLLIVSMKDAQLLRRSPDGEVTTHADLSGVLAGNVNDMVVSETGHAYVGSFGFDLMSGQPPAMSRLAHVAPDGTVGVAADDLAFPNGAVITPDGSTLIVGETMGCAYTAFTIGPDGGLTDRRTWAQLAPRPEVGGFEETLGQVTVAPDGCALDAEGAIWLADAMGGRLLRVAEGGEILEEQPAPGGGGVFACMLGGDDGRTLLACCAPDFFEHERAAKREASLWTLRVDVPHAGLP
jgi:sugar lactone lactonase YvrE